MWLRQVTSPSRGPKPPTISLALLLVGAVGLVVGAFLPLLAATGPNLCAFTCYTPEGSPGLTRGVVHATSFFSLRPLLASGGILCAVGAIVTLRYTSLRLPVVGLTVGFMVMLCVTAATRSGASWLNRPNEIYLVTTSRWVTLPILSAAGLSALLLRGHFAAKEHSSTGRNS